MKIDEKAMRVIWFSGRRDEYEIWAMKMEAKASARGYNVLLGGDGTTAGVDKVPTYDEYKAAKATSPPTDDSKAVLQLNEYNRIGYSELVLSIDTSQKVGENAFNVVTGTKTESTGDHPFGNFRQAWDALKTTHTPKTGTAYTQLKLEYDRTKISEGDDPDVQISQLETLRRHVADMQIKGASKISDVDLMIHILGTLPGDFYDAVSPDLTRRLNDGKLTLVELKQELSEWYEQKTGRQQRNDSFEKALVTTDGGSHHHDEFHDSDLDWICGNPTLCEHVYTAISMQFKGRCYKCGKYGHVGRNCKNDDKSTGNSGKNNNNNNDPPTQKVRIFGKCWCCGKNDGHVKADCPKLKAGQFIIRHCQYGCGF